MVNKTGLPLVFRRVEDEREVAGQFEEHEEARSLTPLPLSKLGSDYQFRCQMRVGRNLRQNEGMRPSWCAAFDFDKELEESRTLLVHRDRDGFEKSYEVGIVINRGKGVFARTKIVTFVPRFQIHNQTKQMLTVTQCPPTVPATDSSSQTVLATNDNDNSVAEELHCHPGVTTNFHWSPKWERVLRVRLLDDNFYVWSGGFRIDKETTYHVTLKSSRKADRVILRVLVTFKSGTYRCLFTSADDYPPPYRLVNFSEVNLFYWQTNTPNSMREFIKPKECKDYVMDEPLALPSLTFSVYQECSESYDLSARGKQHSYRKLYYRNAIFIAFLETFPK